MHQPLAGSVAKSSELTPIPLTNRQARQTTKPGVPSIYVFAIPNKHVDNGINQAAPNSAALRRSSATHFPARFLRHFLIVRSERRPAIGAPTFYIVNEVKKKEQICG